AGVALSSYDISTFLLRFPSERRSSILEFYREQVEESGRELPTQDNLNALFETAEYARFANRVIWPAIALVTDKAEWGAQALAEVEEWFQQFEPVLPPRVPLPTSYVDANREEAEAVFERADLLLNFHYAISPALLARFRRTALVDIDPGLLQFWITRGQLVVPRHDVYFTIGENVGRPGGKIPDCGLNWIPI